MIISSKCNCCIHNLICKHKDDYEYIMKKVKDFMPSKDKIIDSDNTTLNENKNIQVSIRCSYITTNSNVIKGETNV